MTPELDSILCIGTFSLVTLWEIQGIPNESSVSVGRCAGSIAGNDAFIVARELAGYRPNVECCLIGPTTADIDYAGSLLPPGRLRVVGEHDGPITRSLCLENKDGARTWFLSGSVNAGALPDLPSGPLIYLDFYPELRLHFNQKFQQLEGSAPCAFVNLSALTDTCVFPRMEFVPAIVQGSLSAHFSQEQAKDIAEHLLKETGSMIAFVTQGKRGVAMAEERNIWYSAPSHSWEGSVLGAGAVFSSQVILGFCSGLRGSELLESAVTLTSERLRTWSVIDENNRS